MSGLAQAVSVLGEGDFTADGAPKMKPLNAALRLLGEDTLTATQRDDLWSAMAVDEATDLAAESGDRQVTLIAAPANPIRIRINHQTKVEMRVGETRRMSPDDLALLQSTDGVNVDVS